MDEPEVGVGALRLPFFEAQLGSSDVRAQKGLRYAETRPTVPARVLLAARRD